MIFHGLVSQVVYRKFDHLCVSIRLQVVNGCALSYAMKTDVSKEPITVRGCLHGEVVCISVLNIEL